MPEPLPPRWFGSYDDPPASESSTPRTRRSRLQRALQNTTDLARESVNMADVERRSHEGQPSRRRQRSPGDYGHDAEDGRSGPVPDGGVVDRRRSKRRRIDGSPSDSFRPAIKYGQYGQVEPGKLQMEILSCDGGEHVDNRYPQAYLGAKNVLKHDKSVYCSERSHTNLVLTHADHTAFCLEKLHIVGPEHGFTAPIREGLVYVAMSLADLQRYTDPPQHARQRGIHSPPYRRRTTLLPGSIRSSPEQLSLLDALRDPEVNATLVGTRSLSRDRPSVLSNNAEPRHRNSFPSDGHHTVDSDNNCESPSQSSEQAEGEPSEAQVIFLSDEDAGPEDTSTQDVLDFRLQRLRLMRRRYEIESWEREDRRFGSDNLSYESANADRDRTVASVDHLNTLVAHTRMDDKIDAGDALEHAGTMGIGVEEGMKDNRVTCVRFRIKQGKHKVTIQFHPSVSGRFILLKLWAGRSNVDVQSVIAKGYGSLRFFPARELR